ncbi:MAG TPA: translation elongation factor-like protein [Candidatus Aenigmarchaeota archaeon]|nr:translation elongation factor-like protein [Candidatus Aenigmarchaeota archaeon]
MEKKLIGKVTHYFTNIGVAVVELQDEIKVGDRISIEGATTNFEQTVDSMQINKNPVQSAKAGESIGLKVRDRVREGDRVFRLSNSEA